MKPLLGIDEHFVSHLESLNKKRERAIKKINSFSKTVNAEQREFNKRKGVDRITGFFMVRTKGSPPYFWEYLSLLRAHGKICDQFYNALMEREDSLKRLLVMKQSGYWFNLSLAAPNTSELMLHWRLANEILKYFKVYPYALARGRKGRDRVYADSDIALAAVVREISLALKPIKDKSSDRYEQKVMELLRRGGNYTMGLIKWTENEQRNFPKSLRRILPFIRKDPPKL